MNHSYFFGSFTMSEWLETLASNSITQWFFSMAIASTILFLVAFVADWALRKSSSAQRFSVWQMAFAGLLIVPIAYAAFPKINLGWNTDAVVSLDLNGLDELRHDDRETALGSDPLPAGEKILHVRDSQQSGDPRETASLPAKEVSSPELSNQTHFESSSTMLDLLTPVEQTDTATSIWSLPLSFLAVLFYALVALIMLGRIATSCFSVIAIRSRSARFDRRIVETKTPVLVSGEISIPITVGVLNPCIIVPMESHGWSDAKMRMVLKHELAHIHRRDVIWQIMAATAKSIFWFQPLAWFAEYRMRLERERACDNLVLQSSELPSDYAMVLLEIAAQVAGRQLNLAGALSVAEKPIESRLKTILEPLSNRCISKLWFRTSVALMFSLVVLAVSTVRPFNQATGTEPEPTLANTATDATSTEDDEKPKSTDPNDELAPLPDVVTGRIVDNNGKPIAGATADVHIEPYYKWNVEGEDDEIEVETSKTNAEGIFTIQTQGIMAPKGGFRVSGDFFSPMHPSRGMYVTLRNFTDTLAKEKKLHAGDFSLFEGRIVKGQIIAPEEDGMRLTKPIRPFVMAARGMPVSWFGNTIQCDEDGNFEILIPKQGKVEIRAGAQNYCYTRVTAALDKPDLGQIELFKGTEVFGRVLDLDGKPVSNVVVGIEESWEGSSTKLDGMSFGFTSSTKTNKNGEYRFPPHRRECRIEIKKRGQIRGTNDFVKSKKRSPIFKRAKITLSPESETEKEFNITEAQTVRVRGTIRWPDGRPAEGVKVGYQNDFQKTETDKDGKYELNVIKDEEKTSLHSMGAFGPNRVWFYSHGLKELGMQFMTLEHGGKDFDGADWELRKREDLKSRRFKEEDVALDEISDRFNEALKKYNKIAKDERIPHGKSYYTDERAPFDKFATELIEFEKKYPGGFSGLMAIKHVLNWGNEGATVASKQRDAVVERIFDAYLEHPDLHLLIFKLRPKYARDYRARPLNVELSWGETLDRLRRESKNPRVQATFLHMEIKRWSDILVGYRWADSLDWKFPKTMDPRRFSGLKDVDPEHVLNLIKASTKKLSTVYADVPEFHPRYEIPFFGRDIRLRDEFYDSLGRDGKTFAKSATAIVFDLTKLQPGLPVPELIGTDENGNPVDLKDLRGKSVLLFFNYAHTTSNYGSLFDSAKEWQNKYK
ncbi:MAG: M56 family metallopeptidase, partial [Mariniblastus sp.]